MGMDPVTAGMIMSGVGSAIGAFGGGNDNPFQEHTSFGKTGSESPQKLLDEMMGMLRGTISEQSGKIEQGRGLTRGTIAQDVPGLSGRDPAGADESILRRPGRAQRVLNPYGGTPNGPADPSDGYGPAYGGPTGVDGPEDDPTRVFKRPTTPRPVSGPLPLSRPTSGQPPQAQQQGPQDPQLQAGLTILRHALSSSGAR